MANRRYMLAILLAFLGLSPSVLRAESLGIGTAGQYAILGGIALTEGVLVELGIDWSKRPAWEKPAAKIFSALAVGTLFETARANIERTDIYPANLGMVALGTALSLTINF
jgi:hypothetical protein